MSCSKWMSVIYCNVILWWWENGLVILQIWNLNFVISWNWSSHYICANYCHLHGWQPHFHWHQVLTFFILRAKEIVKKILLTVVLQHKATSYNLMHHALKLIIIMLFLQAGLRPNYLIKKEATKFQIRSPLSKPIFKAVQLSFVKTV